MKKFLLGICIFLQSLSIIGQTPYYLSEKTVFSYLDNPEEGQSSKYKFYFKYDVNGYVRYDESYCFNDMFPIEIDSSFIFKSDWIGLSKSEYLNKGLQVFYKWDNNNYKWISIKRIDRKHDTNGNEISCIVYDRETDEEQWMPTSKSEDEYNISNKGTLHTEYVWDKNANDWRVYYKHTDKYDDSGKRVLNIIYNWNNQLNQWESHNKATFNYDDKDRFIFQENFAKTDSVWLRTSKEETRYGKNGEIDSYIFYDWSKDLNEWIEGSRNDVSKNKEIEFKESHHWDSTLKDWVKNVKAESQYDSLGREILSISYQWDIMENIWKQVSKKETEYDEKNNPKSTRSYKWKQEKWVLTEVEENIYKKRE